MDLTAELKTASKTAVEAGSVLTDHFLSGALNTRSKSRRQDVVTDADVAAEKVVLDALLGEWPGDAVLAEESGERDGSSGRRWCVDPLDGTANFASGVPHWAVAIALQVDGETVLAVTYDPSRDELFTAVRGGPARLEGFAMGVAPAEAVEDALIALNLPYDIRHDDAVHARTSRARGLRETGSMALDLAWIAAGRFHLGAHAHNGNLWDYAGGELLVECAGGRVSPMVGFPGMVLVGHSPLIDAFNTDAFATDAPTTDDRIEES
jgi:myo-inositol-1(or 4)-monophosphatase